MTEVTLTLPTSTVIKHHGLETLSVVWGDIPPAVLSKILEVGAKTKLIDTWNGGGKDTPDTERAANVAKKIKAWESGQVNINTRGAAIETLMRDAFRSEMEAAVGALTNAAWADFQKQAAKAAGVKVEGNRIVPVDAFLKGRATILAKRDGTDDVEERFEALTAKFTAAADALAAERAKALDSVDTSGLDF